MSTTRTADPIAAYMDAIADAEDRGCCASDVLALQYLGDSIALFAARLADMANGMADGRMETRHVGLGLKRSQRKFDAQDIAEIIAENVFGDLESYDVIRTAMPLSSMASAAREFRNPAPMAAFENVVDFMAVRS